MKIISKYKNKILTIIAIGLFILAYLTTPLKTNEASSFSFEFWGRTLKSTFQYAQAIAIVALCLKYFSNSSERKKKLQYEAWQVVRLESGKTDSPGRIQALQDLNSYKLELEGLDLKGTNLSGIN